MQRETVNAPWVRTARLRRVVLGLLILLPTIVASNYMAGVLPFKGGTWLELTIVAVFAVLFAWISMGFWTAFIGFVVLLRKTDRFNIASHRHEVEGPITTDSRAAVLIPICNEDVPRVMAGIRATYESIAETGQLDHFDFFILSDSANPDKWVEEEAAWAELCRMVDGFGRIFYRRRRVNLKRKSGNVADFCRRFGLKYPYMIVFDADSVMRGQTMVQLVRLMDRHPNTGLIQTVPMAVNRESMIARVQQFASHAYGPIFSAGLSFWLLGDALYWGHNAIIRIKPFMDHCGLPRLSGKPPLGGDIMSHDFVESALMRRAGWSVWLAYDLGGSYEEVPPTLLDELKRDRRWALGNLQHLRLLLTKGFYSTQRALFFNGAMSYVSSLLWLIFLALSTAEAAIGAWKPPSYFSAAKGLFPEWPIWYPQWALALLASTVVLLFLPKLFCLFLITARERREAHFGGSWRLLASVFLEVIFSTLLAPVRMLFHSKFVFFTLLGQQVSWSGQTREDVGTTWGEAIRFHWFGTVLALMWGLAIYAINSSFFWWLSPILTALILAIPVSAISSRAGVGRALRRHRLFCIPEELDPPRELRMLYKYLERAEATPARLNIPKAEGFIRAVVDPAVHDLHLKLLRGPRRLAPRIVRRREEISNKALTQGPAKLSVKEKTELLYDPERLAELHRQVWLLPDEILAAHWHLDPTLAAPVTPLRGRPS